MTIPDNDLSNQSDYLNTDHDKIQDAANSDAAKFNTDEQEEAANNIVGTAFNDVGNINPDTAANRNENSAPLTTQGSIEEVEEDFSGTTNLSLDQLKKERDPEGMDGE
ncbi:hypothetical protein HH214_12210 [Mucilaginibacter robiniae]|uniref:Uncharacterized protein n=1 Tax=Mucilaginibacter robiniae TaxID=2728022 RepID=A0A7L5E218_9SPHI|nr:hypothetical protein [Mucilaginibacter robiniae]QJD96588.1 hypothetical protein HH214_12210 [Mucilaginibacter robiniae]